MCRENPGLCNTGLLHYNSINTNKVADVLFSYQSIVFSTKEKDIIADHCNTIIPEFKTTKSFTCGEIQEKIDKYSQCILADDRFSAFAQAAGKAGNKFVSCKYFDF